ncbi:TPA: amino acid adenylation domain-containing protein [Legionella pneumophila]|nr:amino acid adenylation domain-containing protein [Legionella pneumophila]
MVSIRPERTHRLHHFFEKIVDHHPNNIALVCNNTILSYLELEHRSNQLAHYLIQSKISPGSLVGILLERSVECYIAILAILKAGATYVPIETEYPTERINYIFSDLPFKVVLTSSSLLKQKKLEWPPFLILDELEAEISKQSSQRLDLQTDDAGNDELCYVIYTSGSTGKPKGVEVPHKSICHYVKVTSELYAVMPDDKVYQGFSLAFDASLEELWMAFANGATLIACTEKEVRSGLGLISFLRQHRVSVFSTVPTLMATLEGELPDLRLLILGGEMCPANLIKRWSRPGLRIMNTYGPTEATVIATYFECKPDCDVTIGKPLPGYEVVIFDENLKEVATGQEGELCIGGAALARGYVNQPQMTDKKFILNPSNPVQRLYRTGDLAFKTPNGELQFAGRVDDQIKLRGFRIELNEIETIIQSYEGVNQAVVSLQHLDQPTLVAYLLWDNKRALSSSELKLFLRNSLPDYMIPSIIEIVDAFPLLTSGKVDRKSLPKPSQVASHHSFRPPSSEMEKAIAQIWQQVLGRFSISIDDDFFHDLGGHSLHAANIISKMRHIFKNVSILDLYKNPTIARLAEKLNHTSNNINERQTVAIEEKYRVPFWKYYLCGIGQLFGVLFQFAIGSWQLLAIILCYTWMTSKSSFISRESQVMFLGLFLCMPLLSLAITVSLKWLLLGKIKPGKYPLWGWFYYRWWLVQRLQKNVFLGKYLVGSPLINWYYRLLGAKIGKNCHIGSMQIFTHDLGSVDIHFNQRAVAAI